MALKRIKKYFLILLGIIFAIIIGYIIYLFATYYRLPNYQTLAASNKQSTLLKPKREYRAMTYNIGYGSYPPSYSFFMDGGKLSVAYSKKSVRQSIAGVTSTTKKVDSDFAFYQEIDTNGDRSQHVNEVNLVTKHLTNYGSVFGQNYDSPYLFYPFTHPIGKARSGLLTLTKANVVNASRHSLPIATDLSKFTDLDRAFTVTKSRVSNGKYFLMVNIHMSAYTKDKSIQNAQFKKLFTFIQDEYQKGNYVLVAGDYNHAILKNSSKIFKTSTPKLTWTNPFPKNKLPNDFYIPTMGLKQAATPSVRNLNQPYKKGRTFVTMIDGYILSKNISAKKIHVHNTEFKYSDHNPVVLDFELK